MDHFKILKRALNITWRYRALWLVGLLLVLAGGGVTLGFNGTPGAPSTPSGNGSPRGNGGPGNWDQSWNWTQFWSKAGPIIVAIGAVLIILFLLFVLLGLVKIIVRYVTRTSLIGMVDRYEENGTELGFWAGLRLGWSASAWRLFLITLLLKLPIVLLALLSIGTLITLAILSFVTGKGPMIALGVVLILLAIPFVMISIVLRILVGPIIEIAYRTCVLEGMSTWQAIKSTFGLIRRQLGPAALQWLLLVGLGIAGSIALIPINLLLVMLAFVIAGLPGLLLGGTAALIAGWPWGLGIGAIAFVPIFILIVALPNMVLSTAATIFYSTTWTLTYRELRVLDAHGTNDQELVVKADTPDEE